MNRSIIQKHQFYAGRFNPFNYTIGLETSIDEAFQSILQYPLPNPLPDEVLGNFIHLLTFYHEAAHLALYASCSYGLRNLRLTNICARYLAAGRNWKLPVVPSLLNRTGQLSEQEIQALDRFSAFLDAADQLRLQYITGLGRLQTGYTSRLEWEPWSPHFVVSLLNQHNQPVSRQQWAQAVEQAGGYIRRLPVIVMEAPGIYSKIVLNTAVLMEAHAIVVEMNHLGNALGQQLASSAWFDFVPQSAGYLDAMIYALLSQSVKFEYMLPTLTACIDIALMYDPFVLYNTPLLDQPGPGQVPDRYPGETFVEACQAAKRLPPIGDDLDSYPAYYERLCAEMGLPTPQWMADKAYEVAQRLITQVRPEDLDRLLLGKAMQLHVNALALRRQSPSSFPFQLGVTNHLLDFVEMAEPAVTFYNLRDHQASSFYYDRMDLVQLHDVLLQMLTRQQVECSLQKGVPFFCDHGEVGKDKLCVWKLENGKQYECRADFFDAHIDYSRRQAGEAPAEAKE